MVLKFDLNYPPPGQDLFSLEAKYGEHFLQFLGLSNHNEIKYQGVIDLAIHEHENERVILAEDIVRLVGPAVKRMRVTALVKKSGSFKRPRNVPEGTDYTYARDQEVVDLPLKEIGNKRVIPLNDIVKLANPSAKRMKLTATTRVVYSRDMRHRFQYLVLEEAHTEESEDTTSKLNTTDATLEFNTI